MQRDRGHHHHREETLRGNHSCRSIESYLRAKVSNSCWMRCASSRMFCFCPFNCTWEWMFECTLSHSSMMWSTECSLEHRTKEREFVWTGTKKALGDLSNTTQRSSPNRFFSSYTKLSRLVIGDNRRQRERVSSMEYTPLIALTRLTRSTEDCTVAAGRTRAWTRWNHVSTWWMLERSHRNRSFHSKRQSIAVGASLNRTRSRADSTKTNAECFTDDRKRRAFTFAHSLVIMPMKIRWMAER